MIEDYYCSKEPVQRYYSTLALHILAPQHGNQKNQIYISIISHMNDKFAALFHDWILRNTGNPPH